MPIVWAEEWMRATGGSLRRDAWEFLIEVAVHAPGQRCCGASLAGRLNGLLWSFKTTKAWWFKPEPTPGFLETAPRKDRHAKLSVA
jgi:hypothetical protein